MITEMMEGFLDSTTESIGLAMATIHLVPNQLKG